MKFIAYATAFFWMLYIIVYFTEVHIKRVIRENELKYRQGWFDFNLKPDYSTAISRIESVYDKEGSICGLAWTMDGTRYEYDGVSFRKTKGE